MIHLQKRPNKISCWHFLMFKGIYTIIILEKNYLGWEFITIYTPNRNVDK